MWVGDGDASGSGGQAEALVINEECSVDIGAGESRMLRLKLEKKGEKEGLTAGRALTVTTPLLEGLGADKDEVHEPDSHGRVHIMMHTRAGASYSLGPGDPVLEVFVFAQTEVREASEQNINQLCNLTAELKAEAIRDINLITQVHDDSKRPRTGAILSLWGGSRWRAARKKSRS